MSRRNSVANLVMLVLMLLCLPVVLVVYVLLWIEGPRRGPTEESWFYTIRYLIVYPLIILAFIIFLFWGCMKWSKLWGFG